MKGYIKDYILGAVAGVIVGYIGTMTFTSHYYYKRGQVDAINGAVYYKLEKQLDGSTEWEKHTEIVKPE